MPNFSHNSLAIFDIKNEKLSVSLEPQSSDADTLSAEPVSSNSSYLNASDIKLPFAESVIPSFELIDDNNNISAHYLLKIQDFLALKQSIIPASLSHGLFQRCQSAIEKRYIYSSIKLSEESKRDIDNEVFSSLLKNKKLKALIEKFFHQFSEEDLNQIINNKSILNQSLKKELADILSQIKNEILISRSNLMNADTNEIIVKKAALITLSDSIIEKNKNIVGIKKEFSPPLEDKKGHSKSANNSDFYLKKNKKIDEVIKEKLLEIKFNLKHANPEKQQKYRSALEEYLNFISTELPQYKVIFDKIRAFYSQEETLFFTHHNRLSVSFRILELILYPSSIDQGSSYLCGIASFFSMLAHAIPSELIDMCLEFAETGQIGKPLFIQATLASKNKENDIIQLFMHSLKNAINKTGYNNLSKFEVIQGVTRPKQIVMLLNKFGFTDITESMVLQTPSKRPISPIHNLLLGGLYSHVHAVEKDKEKSLNILSQHLASGQKAIILLSAYQHIDFEASLFGVGMAHYVYLSKLEIHNDEVHIETETYGEKSTDVYSKEEFLSIYQGAICATPPQMNHHLQIEQVEMNENYLIEGHILSNKF